MQRIFQSYPPLKKMDSLPFLFCFLEGGGLPPFSVEVNSNRKEFLGF